MSSLPFVEDCHFQPLDDESAATDLSLASNLLIPEEVKPERKYSTGTPRISRSVSFNASPELIHDMHGDQDSGHDQDLHGINENDSHTNNPQSENNKLSYATYSASEDDGALAMAAREVALKTRRAQEMITTTPAPVSAVETQKQNHEIMQLLEDLRVRMDQLEKLKVSLPATVMPDSLAGSSNKSVQSGVGEMSKPGELVIRTNALDTHGNLPQKVSVNDKSPVRSPARSPKNAPSSKNIALNSSKVSNPIPDFGFGNLSHEGKSSNSTTSSSIAGATSSSNNSSNNNEPKFNTPQFLTPNGSPMISAVTATGSARPHSNSDLTIPGKLQLPKEFALPPSMLGPQLIIPPQAHNRLAILSAKLARGMDGTTTWDDGAIIWREREPSPAAAVAEATKVKPKLFGPGLAVFDKVADPDRREDEAASERRWIEAAPPLSLWNFLRSDLLAPSAPPQVEESIGQGVNQFLKVPMHFEKFVVFGVFISLDLFLSVLTFLPMRSVLSLTRLALSLLFTPLVVFSSLFLPKHFTDSLLKYGPFLKEHKLTPNSSNSKVFRFWPKFHRTDAYDLLRVVLFVGTLLGLQLLDMSRVYHNIRGQALIKLYVILNMVEIFDRLLSSFGQDALDSLYRTVSTSPFSIRLIFEIPIATVYIMLHACLFFVNVATINVAVNSADQALLSLLVSNNFSEIRSNVFKKFDTNNYFQLCSSDTTERFKLVIFMLLVLLMNLVQNADKDKEIIMNFIFQTGAVLGAEVFADWIKHAFITKFNALDSSLYSRFTAVLVQDVTETRHDTSRPLLDHTHSLARRIGLAQLPLACTVVRFLQDVWVRLVMRFDLTYHGQIRLLGSGFVCLFLLKVLTGIILAGLCAQIRIREERMKKNKKRVEEFNRQTTPKASSKAQT